MHIHISFTSEQGITHFAFRVIAWLWVSTDRTIKILGLIIVPWRIVRRFLKSLFIWVFMMEDHSTKFRLIIIFFFFFFSVLSIAPRIFLFLDAMISIDFNQILWPRQLRVDLFHREHNDFWKRCHFNSYFRWHVLIQCLLTRSTTFIKFFRCFGEVIVREVNSDLHWWAQVVLHYKSSDDLARVWV